MNALGTDLTTIAQQASIPLPGDKPSGTVPMRHGFITLRDPDKIAEKVRRPAKRALIALQPFKHEFPDDDATDEQKAEAIVSTEAMDASWALQDALAVCMIESWSYDGDVTIDNLLATVDYDEICRVVSPFLDCVFPNFGVSNDPKVPAGE